MLASAVKVMPIISHSPMCSQILLLPEPQGQIFLVFLGLGSAKQQSLSVLQTRQFLSPGTCWGGFLAVPWGCVPCLSLTRINSPPARSCTHGSDLHLLLLPPASKASTQRGRWVGAVAKPSRSSSSCISNCLLHHNHVWGYHLPSALLSCWPVILCYNFTAWKVHYLQVFIAKCIHTYLLQSPC